MPLSPSFPTSELQYIVNHSEASLLVSSSKFVAKTGELLGTDLTRKPAWMPLEKHVGGPASEHVTLSDDTDGENAAGLMLYTSGTTNRPVREATLLSCRVLTVHPRNPRGRKESSSRTTSSRRSRSR